MCRFLIDAGVRAGRQRADLRRPVDDVLVGWHIQDGYMWQYVSLAYLLAYRSSG